ncbi:N-acetylmuramoyl-L-alanine amidase [Parabacteroides pacaensis]|uniref:N-acetylmuramoyl-L-alanine amidase n=1 Tax=Parabacteroides pacaensis TaxID=2086575 RepID=UPI000D0F4399|nr:N-acetylmuramoyl-L-alanine amidase [Parabacteroides pacaensis]
MKILIDNGHGAETPGKRSPDGQLREYAYAREIALRVVSRLQSAGIDALRLVPEETDVPLKERVARANKAYAECGRQALLVSVHCNAAGDGSKWMSARGWSIFVDTTASARSKQLATEIARVAKSKGITVRQSSPSELYWSSDLYLCKHSNCPAALVENFFQDNKEDVAFLLSEAGKQCVTDITAEGIMNYLATLRKELL